VYTAPCGPKKDGYCQWKTLLLSYPKSLFRVICIWN